MPKRVQSPSSINTFKQCPRKYYFQYIEKQPTFPTIHTVRGNIAHSVLEHFYDIDISSYNEQNYQINFKTALQKLTINFWNNYKKELDDLGLTKDQEKFYFEETMFMLMNWTNQFIASFDDYRARKMLSIEQAFEELKPIRELEYRSEKNSVRGFIDAIHNIDDEVHIIDYKTNSRFEIKESIMLQLSIYCLLYKEKHGKIPDKVGIHFLRHKPKILYADESMVETAKKELAKIHAHTESTADIADYPKRITPLCKWSTGECAFYKICKPHG